MKENYLIFGWSCHTHNSSGGWDHYLGSAYTIEDAKEDLECFIGDNLGSSNELEYAQIIRMANKKVIYTWSKYR